MLKNIFVMYKEDHFYIILTFIPYHDVTPSFYSTISIIYVNP